MNYYDENALEFFKRTVNTDMTPQYVEFVKLIPENGSILDAGCGSGRDAKKFKELGFKVTAIDGSREMCRLASEYTGIDVKHLTFDEIAFEKEFDGIWASASLLHVPSMKLNKVLDKLRNSLKGDGVLYASFKYGDSEGLRNGRYFNDLTQDSARELFERRGFEVIRTWKSSDARLDRDEEWVNVLAKFKE